ncbi:MAG: cell division initiation protein [Actinomycetota bacterium]|jgi:DivIVA domain-containing protein|nr:cell division initiation protein [Actinomycetota bacterium]
MDLTPKLLTDIEFPMWWRGYKPEEVDEFLERVAVGVSELQQLLAELRERASTAERRLLERSDEDEIRRTLVLAQRTAEASVSEARTEAERLLREAQERASSLDAEVDERRRAELGALAERRAELEGDIDALRAFVDGERERMVATMGEHVDFLTTSFALGDAPPTSPEPVIDDAPSDGGKVQADVAMAAAPAVDEDVDDDDDDGDDDDDDDDVDAPSEAGLRSASENLADALRRAGLDDLITDDSGEPTGPHDAVIDAGDDADGPAWREPGETADDPFLAELRRAVSDTEPLGPRDHEVVAQDDSSDAGDAGGFLRRRRRA